jgi:hypothetical protein
MLIIVEPNHTTVIIAAPVLRVDTNQHQIDLQNRSRWSLVNPIRLSCPNISWQIWVLRLDSWKLRVTSSQHCWFVLYIIISFICYTFILSCVSRALSVNSEWCWHVTHDQIGYDRKDPDPDCCCHCYSVNV